MSIYHDGCMHLGQTQGEKAVSESGRKVMDEFWKNFANLPPSIVFEILELEEKEDNSDECTN